jgi:RNA polymerase sigma factor (sigma-70 family)
LFHRGPPARPIFEIVVGPDAVFRFTAGDPDAVREIYDAYGRLVYAVAYKLLGDPGLAEEATQQAFVAAWRASATFDATRELGPWLATIARRSAIDIHRREARRPHEPLDIDHPAMITLPPAAERLYDIWEVRRAIAALPADDADLIRLQHFEGFTQTEIAAQLGIPVGTVKSRAFRVHRRLASLLGHLGDSDEPLRADGRRERTSESTP